MINQNHLIYLAPLQGITDKVYRNCYIKYFGGIDKLFTPFVADVSETKIHRNKLKDLYKETQTSVKTIPQILSNNPSEILLMARTFASMGFTEMNWNLGCPFAKVANKKRGSGLLPFPGIINEILQKIMPLPLKLSIKTRLGRFENTELKQVIEIINHYQIEELIVHARTGIQMYKGQTQPGKFEEYSHLTNIPTVYNGDIFTVEDFNNLNLQFKTCTRWMIGRGILQNPFLPAEIKQTSHLNPENKLLRVCQFHNELFRLYNAEQKDKNYVLGRMKGIMVYLKSIFNCPPQTTKKLFKTKTEAEYLDIFRKITESGLIPNL